MTENRLSGKLALVTGATAGIGKETSRLLADAGSDVAITGRREERLHSLKQKFEDEYEVNVVTGAFDIRDRDACEAFVNSLERPVDLLINNAGLARGTDPVHKGRFEDWDTMIDTNIKGLLTLTRLVTPGMKERSRGHVINIGSIAGHEAYPGGVVYCATKHAVKAITEATKKDLHGTGVRASMVSPGLVETEFSVVRYKGDEDRADEVYEDMTPLTPSDIAEIVIFIANRPDHVNIMDTIVFPVDQSSSTMVYRDED